MSIDFSWGLRLQELIEDKDGLPKDLAIQLLWDYVYAEAAVKVLSEQLLYSIQSGGDYIILDPVVN